MRFGVYSKFVSEGFDVNSASYKQAIEDCKLDSRSIVNAISSKSSEQISQYVNSL